MSDELIVPPAPPRLVATVVFVSVLAAGSNEINALGWPPPSMVGFLASLIGGLLGGYVLALILWRTWLYKKWTK